MGTACVFAGDQEGEGKVQGGVREEVEGSVRGGVSELDVTYHETGGSVLSAGFPKWLDKKLKAASDFSGD